MRHVKIFNDSPTKNYQLQRGSMRSIKAEKNAAANSISKHADTKHKRSHIIEIQILQINEEKYHQRNFWTFTLETRIDMLSKYKHLQLDITIALNHKRRVGVGCNLQTCSKETVETNIPRFPSAARWRNAWAYRSEKTTDTYAPNKTQKAWSRKAGNHLTLQNPNTNAVSKWALTNQALNH